VRSATINMHAIDRHEALRGHSVGIVRIHVRYRAKLLQVLVLQLHLWHLRWLVAVHSVSGLRSLEPYMLHFMSEGQRTVWRRCFNRRNILASG
jgi:hypothetical protein